MENSIKMKLKEELKKSIGEEDLNLLIEQNAFIAGGALTSVLTNKNINDFDIYFRTEKECEKTIDYFNHNCNFICIIATDNAVTFKRSNGTVIQLIQAPHLINECIYDTISSFDFTINMAAYDLMSDMIITDNNFYKDNMARRLVFNEDTNYPIVSLHRAIKYIYRGYNLSGYEQVKIALAINNLKMTDYTDLKYQLQGIDTSIFKPITDKLMEQPETKYNYEEVKRKLNENKDELS